MKNVIMALEMLQASERPSITSWNGCEAVADS